MTQYGGAAFEDFFSLKFQNKHYDYFKLFNRNKKSEHTLRNLMVTFKSMLKACYFFASWKNISEISQNEVLLTKI